MNETKSPEPNSTIKRIVENRFDRALLVLACFFLFVGSVLAGVSVYQGTVRNAKIDRIEQAATEAKDAAKDAEQIVKAAVNASKTPAAQAQAKAVIEALQRIGDIKVLLEEHIKSMQKFYQSVK